MGASGHKHNEENENERLKNKNKSLENENESLLEEVKKKAEEIFKLNLNINKLNSEKHRLNLEKNGLDAVKQEKEELEIENKDLKIKIDELKKLVQENIIIIEKLTKENKKIIIENNSLKYSKMILAKSKSFLCSISDEEIQISIKNKYKLFLENYEYPEINKLINNEIFKEKINKYKDNAINTSISLFMEETKHINVILLGLCGVGKSTLINALTESDAKTGGPKPVTDKCECYESESRHLRLWDTIGIEINDKRNAKKILDMVKKIIEDAKNKGPDWFIHCIWYCTRGSRFQDDEEGIIKKLINIYPDGKMPIIIAYLNCVNKEERELVESGCKKSFPNFDFIPLLSRDIKDDNDKILFKSFGLADITKKTIIKFSNSINSNSFVYVKNNVINNIKKYLEDINIVKNLNDLFDNVCGLCNNLIGPLNESQKKNIKFYINDIIKICKEHINFSEEISNHIEQFKESLKNDDEKYSTKVKQLKDLKDENSKNDEIAKICDNIRAELESRYEKVQKESILILNDEIYNFILNAAKNEANSIICEYLKNIEVNIKEELESRINNSPNFQELFREK